MMDCFAPGDRPFVREVILPAMWREGRWVGEFRFRHLLTGQTVPMLYDQFTISDERGEVIGVATVSRDLTEEKRASEALRESEERFRLLADNISQFAWITDETGWVHWYNQRWYDYTGTTLEQMQGWGWQAALPAPRRGARHRLQRSAGGTGRRGRGGGAEQALPRRRLGGGAGPRLRGGRAATEVERGGGSGGMTRLVARRSGRPARGATNGRGWTGPARRPDARTQPAERRRTLTWIAPRAGAYLPP
jgi:PAS domain S-box-containing protein